MDVTKLNNWKLFIPLMSRTDYIVNFPIKKFWPCWEVEKDILWVMLKYMKSRHPEWLYSINFNEPQLLPKTSPWIKCFPGRVQSQRARNMCKTITCEPTGSLGDNQDPWLRLNVDGYTAGSAHGSVPWKSSAVAKGEAISQQRWDGLWLEPEVDICCVPTTCQALFQVLLTEEATRVP